MTQIIADRMALTLSDAWPGQPRNATDARHWLIERLAAESGGVRYKAEQIIGELIANAIKHTYSGSPGGRFVVAVDAGSPWVWVGVIDEGAVTEPVATRLETGVLYESRMGLAVVEALAEAWGHEPYGRGRITWATIAR
jgi:anti-sigma regulatory factor (Ser/Thr protein kinase)